MPLTGKEVWLVIHGMGLGATFLLAYAGGLAGLWSLRAEWVTVAGIPAVLIGTGIQNFRMEGSSMVPAYESGQYILVNKLVYKFDDPQQGDVIVFRFPKDPSRLFAKRIIGLPGDTVAISDGTVFVNRKPLEEPYLAVRDSSDMALRHLGEREYFVLGDNRRGSNDSRNWGPVPEENIVGKMWITYYGPQD